MKLGHVLLLAAIVCLVTVIAITQLYYLDRPLFVQDTTETEYIFFVADSAGFDVATDKLRLGAVAPGQRSQRVVTVHHASASSVSVRASGNGTEMLVFEREHPLINGSADIQFAVVSTPDAELGEYTGVVRFYFK